VSSHLRPPILDDLGLAAAIEWQTEEFEKRTGIPCKAMVTADLDLPTDTAISLFRIYQEILTNVARHARATHVTTRYAKEGGRLTLTGMDDGVGLPPERSHDTSSLGLRGMRERASLLGAQIKFDRPPDGGR
jgi:signal transduction histidine kinase